MAKFRAIGTKETQKNLERDNVLCVYIAQDADERVVGPIYQLARQKGIEVMQVPSMKELGKACGIRVGAASAACLREP